MSSGVVYGATKSAVGAINTYNKNTMATTKVLKYQHIAPAPAGGSVGGVEVKTRKYTPRGTLNGPFSVDQTHSVQRRNARERNRVKQVNNSFARLRQHIPQTIIADLTKGGGRGPQKKISKVDTLRIAVEYIRRLQDLVDDLNGGNSSGSCSAANSDNAQNNLYNATSAPASLVQTAQLYNYTQSTSPLPAFQHPQLESQVTPQSQHFPSSLLTPTSVGSYSPPHTATQTQLDTVGCHSPTSSFNSSMSFDSGTYESAPQQLSPAHAAAAAGSSAHLDAHLQLKFEPYENFNLHEEDCTPDEEEILDYISLWQEQQ